MSAQFEFDRCLSFINCQLLADRQLHSAEPTFPIRAVTISRQAGCGALAVAQQLAEYLQARTPATMAPWTVFDRNLVAKVLEDHNLPQRLAKFMPEDWISDIQDTLDELFGLHPPSWLLVRQTAETILRLAKLGNAIIIGRAANVITARMEQVFHVRLVAPLERRSQHIQVAEQLDPKSALEFIREQDNGRKRYLRKYYQKDISNPLLYHLVINTDLLPYAKAARIIRDAVLNGGVTNAVRAGTDVAKPILQP